MRISKQRTRTSQQFQKPLIATFLALGGLGGLVNVVLADTAAGTQISNQATATYRDSNNNSLVTQSNVVTVTVGEVAGITITGSSVTNNSNPGQAPAPGNVIFYDFTITNVGNDPTQFRIPNTALVNGPGTRGNLIIDPSGTYGGPTTLTGDANTPTLQPGQSIVVRVPITVDTNALNNDAITVQLGNATGQNQPYNANGGDVYTVDSPFGTDTNNDGKDDTTGEINGVPVNGTREASASLTATVGTTIQNQALATLLKTLDNHNANNPSSLTDDQLTYGLILRVENTPPAGSSVTPSSLIGTTISVNRTGAANNETRILVSDAVPANTVFDPTVAPQAPAGWEVVYSPTAVTTNANAATWFTTVAAAGGAGAVTRVGFINTNAGPSSINPGQTVGTFRFTVVTTNYDPSAGGQNDPAIANIAQVFGTTQGSTTLVYDESGDQTPSNYNATGSIFNNTPTDGHIDPTDTTPANDIPDEAATIGIDPGSNTGTANDGTGEVLLFSPTATPTNGISNGPLNNPFAAGPTDTNDDFTNKSAPITSGDLTGNALQAPVTVPFTGTFALPGNTTNTAVALLPTLPAALPGGNAADLPTNTVVTIIDPGNPANRAYYRYNSGGGGSWTKIAAADPTAATVTTPPIYVTVPNANTINYGVEVRLPATAPLSTTLNNPTTPALGDVLGGLPVPVTAYIDSDNNPATVVDPTNGTTFTGSNRTIFRTYTGFLQLLKESRVLQGSGPAVPAGQGTFSTTAKTPAPGNIIEYRVTYFNITESNAGTGNIILNAQNIQITEDGLVNGNNWARDNDGDTEIDTSHVIGFATDSRGGSVSYFSGNPSTTPAATEQSGTTVNTDITRYLADSPGILNPQQSGAFTFRRQVN
jgi:hypothetical protein